ncbi:hypothetical protein EJ08DRAFT_609857 [Tothia fuscella]|uniref:Altered inheritance of mitochondria protein 6 n=1 Tax=Tothia fuscella TaxID=1048955 RepID=A0A9P4NUV7_9PEZI|nr:hypothetical protein EJ08DRAFT_609857 [Tothia fuscella]
MDQRVLGSPTVNDSTCSQTRTLTTYSSTTTESSGDNFTTVSLQQDNTRQRLSIWPNLISSGYGRIRRELRTYKQPGLKRDLASWVGVAVVGSSLMITLLFHFLFVWQPKSEYDLASHNFISNNPIIKDGKAVDGLNRWTEDFSRTVIPIMVHSHNDYWRPYPLFSALAAGCTGVEADVWLSDDGKDLLVGHDRSQLHPGRTLKSMYLDPLLEILDRNNPEDRWGSHTVYDRASGVFGTQPNTTLVLLIDVKTEPQKTWDLVQSQMEPLRKKQYLTRQQIVYTYYNFIEKQMNWPGPVTIVATGNMNSQAYHKYGRSHQTYAISEFASYEGGQTHDPFSEYHDYFYDAPLDILPQYNKFYTVNDETGKKIGSGSQQLFHSDTAYYASVSFNQAIGSVRTGFSDKQLATLREQIYTAKMTGLQARYWDLPAWPINYRDYVWDVLTREGVGMLSVDDLESAARRGWSKGYIRSVVWLSVLSVWMFVTSVVTLRMVYTGLRRSADLLRQQRNEIYLG